MSLPVTTAALCLFALLFEGDVPMAESSVTDAVIARHVEWLGGREALADFSTLRASGTVETAGLHGTLSLAWTRDGSWRRQLKLGAIETTEVRGPAGAWALNWSGQLEPLGAERQKEAIREGDWLFGRYWLGVADVERLDRGRETREGREWRVIRFAFPDGDFFEVFLDEVSGACSWLRVRKDTRTFLRQLSDWRFVRGVRVPFSDQSFHDDPKLDSTTRWTSVEINTELPGALFSAPATREVLFEIAGGANSTGPLEVDLVEGRYVFLPAVIAGRQVSVLLDSGANTSVVDSRFAQDVGLASSGNLLLEGTSRSQQAAVAAGVQLQIGALRLSGLTAVVTDLSSVETALGRPVPVILGKEVFHALVVEIDYPGSRLSFHDPVTFRPDPAARGLALIPGEAGSKLVELTIEDHPPALFALDTGSGSVITLFEAYTTERRLLEGRAPRSERLLRGIGGGSAVTIATLSRLSLAGFILERVPAEFYRDEQGAFHTLRIAGNLGAAALSRFRVTFDYGRGWMYLAAGTELSKPFCKNRVGLDADFRGDHLDVVFVAPGSPAAEAGWKIGQRVVAIDGHPIGADFLTSSASPWWCGVVGEAVLLTDGEGRDHELVRRDYY